MSVDLKTLEERQAKLKEAIAVTEKAISDYNERYMRFTEEVRNRENAFRKEAAKLNKELDSNVARYDELCTVINGEELDAQDDVKLKKDEKTKSKK